MKRKVLIICILVVVIASLSACGIPKTENGDVKVIPKTSGDETKNTNSEDTKEAENTAKPKDSINAQDPDLEEKLKSLKEEAIKDIIESRSMEVLNAIKAQDMNMLSEAVHPEKGLRISPYGYVNTETDQVFTKEQVNNLVTDTKKYLWGSYDGTGDPIELTFQDYYKKFIYDVDFVNAEETGFNKILGHGNSLINYSEVYPKAIIVEYYFSGFDPQYEGMDWRSLRLAFEKKDDTWYLVGIIHDQWTI